MHLSRILLTFIFLVLLNGCNLQNLKSSPSSSSGNTAEDLSDIAELNKTAQHAYQTEDWKTAEIAYQKLAKKVPGEPEPWFRLGNIYAKTDRLDAAESAYRNALARDSESGKIWHNLGIVYLRQATNTFAEMLQYTKDDDPLNTRAKNVLNSVSNLMDTGFQSGENE